MDVLLGYLDFHAASKWDCVRIIVERIGRGCSWCWGGLLTGCGGVVRDCPSDLGPPRSQIEFGRPPARSLFVWPPLFIVPTAVLKFS